jgi:hypothetical protein
MLKKCTRCKRKKRLDLFYKDSHTKDGYRTACKSCNKKKVKKLRASGDVSYAASKILSSMKYRSKKKNFKPPEFTKQEIEDILENGRCEVTNRGFECSNITEYSKNPFNASPDRIDNSKGYTKDNVRWVMFWVNNCRGDYSIEFFRKLLRGVRW